MVKPRALAIEDDKEIAELYRHVLESLGFEAEIIRTGEAALVRLATTVPAVVLLDLNLISRVSGSDILYRIRADRRLTRTKVVVITGYPVLADTVRDRADAVLIKPVDVKELSELIGRLYPREKSE